MNNEHIRHAAVRFPDGIIYTGPTHGHALEKRTGQIIGNFENGYVTTRGRFVDNETARQIAVSNGQVTEQAITDARKELTTYREGETPDVELEAVEWNIALGKMT